MEKGHCKGHNHPKNPEELVIPSPSEVKCLSNFSLVNIFGSDRSSRKANVSACVSAFGPSLSRAVNLHHSGSNLQAISQE